MKICYYFEAKAAEKGGGTQLKIGLCFRQKNQSETIRDHTYPLCHLLLQKGLNYSKDAFENPGLVNYVNSLDSDWKPIL